MHQRLRRYVAQTLWNDPYTTEYTRHFAISRCRGMTEAQGACLCAWREQPESVVADGHFSVRGCAVDEALGGLPLRIVIEIAGIGCEGFQHAEGAATADEHAADGDGIGETDAQMARACLAAFAEFDAAEVEPGLLCPYHDLWSSGIG